MFAVMRGPARVNMNASVANATVVASPSTRLVMCMESGITNKLQIHDDIAASCTNQKQAPAIAVGMPDHDQSCCANTPVIAMLKIHRQIPVSAMSNAVSSRATASKLWLPDRSGVSVKAIIVAQETSTTAAEPPRVARPSPRHMLHAYRATSR